MIDDEKVVEMLWGRCEDALSVIERRYGRLAYSLSYNILHVNEDAEECVSDALLAVWNTIPPKRPKSLLAYICSLVRNISFNRYDYNHASKRNGEMNVILDELDEVIPSSENVAEDVERGRISEVINAFLAEEKEKDRIIFVRRYYYSDGISDIAERVGISEAALAMRLSRMRARLKKKLEEEGITI